MLLTTGAWAAPKVILIALDGATPWLLNQFMAGGVLSRDRGHGLLQGRGIKALQNITVSPSPTAPGHIATATGSTAAANDVVANSFHLIASPFTSNISGFAAPIGGYLVDPPREDPMPTAEPIWLTLRNAGKKVVTATWPGADGADSRLPPASPTSPILQSSSRRTADYTVPFGAFAGVGAWGFSLTAADSGPAPTATTEQLAAAGRTPFSPVLQTASPLEAFSVGGITYAILVAALDTADDHVTNYDTPVFFDATSGIQPGPFSPPSTGPAYEQVDRHSSPFYLEGSSNKAGTAFFVSALAADPSTVRVARYSANFIPRNPPVPDGPSHQFLLIDPRQPTDFTNPVSIFEGQDAAKVARYRSYVQEAYQVANHAVQALIDAVGTDAHGEPNSNIFVVSDHGFAPFHTAVSLDNLLVSHGIDLPLVRAVTSGSAANIYIRLAGREPDGTVSQSEYLALQRQMVDTLVHSFDTNALYTPGAAEWPVFDKIYIRPAELGDPDFSKRTSEFIGQDSGDVLLAVAWLQLRRRTKPCVHPTG
jgi:hypothetical protein